MNTNGGVDHLCFQFGIIMTIIGWQTTIPIKTRHIKIPKQKDTKVKRVSKMFSEQHIIKCQKQLMRCHHVVVNSVGMI
jgi:hypothetical protein